MSIGFLVNSAQTKQEILYALADKIPDAFVELFATGLPLVPGTQRPAVPKIVDEVAVWVDPSGTTGWSRPVGEYQQ
ncbi:hypothetical protein GCM10010331_80090 [Streptomyces xanthochromogenes]|nr:hypothetical protein GCM10010331_80090 [Streptomyces xanthochromogenes]